MLRRFSSVSALPVASVALARRFYTPPADLTKLYQSDFDHQQFPCDIVPSDATLFAKFLYKSAEASNNFETITKDFQTIAAASKKLPVFWQRSITLETVAEFKGLSPATTFTLFWMQSNGMLEIIPNVEESFATYVNAKQKKAVAKVYVNPKQVGDAAVLAKAKEIATKLQAANKALAGFNLVILPVPDVDIVSGFAVDLAGAYHSEAKGEEIKTGSGAEKEIDYTQVPASKFVKTKWEDSAETEVLGKYFESLAKYDAEEAKIGV
jgi:hypothetical protein